MVTVPGGSTADLQEMLSALGGLAPAVDDADRIERVRLFEELKSVCAAAQAATAVEFDRAQRAVQAVAGVPAARQGRGVSAQLALARRVSPWQGQRWLGWAKILITELPATYAELRAGRTSEWRAILMARETAVLSREDRATVDRELASRLAGWGDRRVETESRKAAYRLDPAAAVARAATAEADRRVTIRPLPDVMSSVSTRLPVAQGVAVYAALCREADSVTAAGDTRGRGQIMADTLVERVTGQAQAGDVPVEITLVMTDQTLFNTSTPGTPATGTSSPATGNDSASSDSTGSDSAGSRSSGGGVGANDRRDGGGSGHDADADSRGGADEPAWLDGYGPVPAGWARDLALTTHTHTDSGADAHSDSGATSDTADMRTDHGASGPPRWIRRLFTDPAGRLVALESTRRDFTPAQRRYIQHRDQLCRTPWCEAPIRHTDHLRPHGKGGPTHTHNAQGLCAACNYAREAAGWHGRVTGNGTIHIQTPTGHTYPSRLPDLPGHPRRTPTSSPLEQRLAALLAAA